MRTFRSLRNSSSGPATRTLLFAILIMQAACTPRATPTLFVAPTSAEISLTAAAPTATSASPPHLDGRAHADAITRAYHLTHALHQRSEFRPGCDDPGWHLCDAGAMIDKQWLVTNSGTCNWDASYRIKLISGDAMGVPSEQELYPARAGTEATLQMIFTAPQNIGTYQSAWQAFGPDGTAFGQAITIQVNVSP